MLMGFSIDPAQYASLIENSLLLNNNSLATAIQRLSTGLRINSAADDPAGLAISNVLQGQVSGLNQAVQNAQNGISLIQTASGALQGTQTTLQNMLQLATQAATGTYSASDLASMQAQMSQDATQITHATINTTYNGHNLLTGALQNMQVQLGANAGATAAISISPMDAASLGVAGNAATLAAGSNTADIGTLTNVGTGFLGNPTSEQYQIKTTGIVTTTAALYNAAGVASTSASAGANQGSETLALGGAYSGGSTQNYVIQVTGVNSQGVITGIKYAQANTGAAGTLGAWTNATFGGTTPLANGNVQSNFTLNNGITAQLTNGAATSQVGDTFTFTANFGGGYTNQQSSSMFTQATGTLTGTYTGTTNLAYAVRASQIDSNNNVVGVQVSADGGHTWGATIQTTTGGYNPGMGVTTAGAAGTTTAFSIGNGLTYNWAPGSFIPGQVAANNDTQIFFAVAANQNVQFLQLADSTQVSGAPRYSGAAANIGTGIMLNAGQTSATVGINSQQITANFAAPGASGGIQVGSATFTVATPQAAVVANGTVLANPTAPAGINISTQAAASAALTAIQNAISQVSAQQGQLGAVQNRLTGSIATLMSTSTNLQSSYVQIMGADIAQETINLTRAKIIQQSAISMLAQANQMPGLALKLLG